MNSNVATVPARLRVGLGTWSTPQLEAKRIELLVSLRGDLDPARRERTLLVIGQILGELHCRELNYRRAKGLRDPEAVH